MDRLADRSESQGRTARARASSHTIGVRGVARLLDRASYDDATGRALHVVLAELGQLCGYSAFDLEGHGLAQRSSQVCGPPTPRMTGPLVPISWQAWPARPPTEESPRTP